MLTECARVKNVQNPKPQKPKPLKLGRAQPARDASRGRGGLDLVPSAVSPEGTLGRTVARWAKARHLPSRSCSA